jgi:hypothetical protein
VNERGYWMFTKGLLLKVIFGSLAGLVVATGVIYMAFVKPFAPTNLDVTIDKNNGSVYDPCTPILQFLDNSQNEDEFRVYRRNFGTSAFTLIQVLPPNPGKGNQVGYADRPSLGTYEYQVSAYNKLGESFSNIKKVSLDYYSDACASIQTIDPSTLPMNPIIVSLSIINDCNVRISFRDNSTNEQGFKIVRSTANSGLTIVTTLGPHAGIPGTYDDKTKLPPGKYYYFINVYNQKGGNDSNASGIEVTSVCNPAMHALPTVNALVLPTLQKLSGGTCNWEAATNVFLRKGPDVAVFDRLVYAAAGQSFPIVGQSEDGRFWAVEVDPGIVGYVTKSGKYSLTNGDCSIVPPLTDPAPPVIAPTSTEKSGGAATPCPVGDVCP